eukprot:3962787-Karenia_brevis.AAC.1
MYLELQCLLRKIQTQCALNGAFETIQTMFQDPHSPSQQDTSCHILIEDIRPNQKSAKVNMPSRTPDP